MATIISNYIGRTTFHYRAKLYARLEFPNSHFDDVYKPLPPSSSTLTISARLLQLLLHHPENSIPFSVLSPIPTTLREVDGQRGHGEGMTASAAGQRDSKAVLHTTL